MSRQTRSLDPEKNVDVQLRTFEPDEAFEDEPSMGRILGHRSHIPLGNGGYLRRKARNIDDDE